MPTQAKVASLDALEAFRARLIVFIDKAHQSLDQVGDEIRRTRSWIQHDQRMHWEGEVRRRGRVLAQAEQELLSARMVKLVADLTRQQVAVRKARLALEEAQRKLHKVKLWNRDFDAATEPLGRNLNALRDYLTRDLQGGVAYLLQVQKTLEAYGEIATPLTASAPAPDLPPGSA